MYVCVCVRGVEGGSSSAFERRQNKEPRSPEVRVGWEEGSLKLREKDQRGGAEKDSLPPPEKPWKNCAPSVRSACQSKDGDFFFHPRTSPFSPPSLKQASRSVNVLRALGQVKPAGFGGRETDEITREALSSGRDATHLSLQMMRHATKASISKRD